MKMENKTIVITGANRGIGKVTALELAREGAKIYLACRSVEQGEVAADEIKRETGNQNVFVLKLDLSSFSSVKIFSETFGNLESKLDVLINNAGLWNNSKLITENGIENTFAVNVVGHHLLTKLLLNKLKNAAPSKIINVASHFAGHLQLDDINFEKRKYNGVKAYQQTKQANRMLTREWARRLQGEGISVYSMTPGFIPSTDLFREQTPFGKMLLKLFGLIEGKTVEQGADTVIYLASEFNISGSNGGFFRERKETKCKFFNPEDEKKLWDKCEEFLSNF